jgi:hypothetical protein
MKLKCFFITKEMVTILKRLLTKWEKIIASYIPERDEQPEYIGSSKN